MVFLWSLLFGLILTHAPIGPPFKEKPPSGGAEMLIGRSIRFQMSNSSQQTRVRYQACDARAGALGSACGNAAKKQFAVCQQISELRNGLTQALFRPVMRSATCLCRTIAACRSPLSDCPVETVSEKSLIFLRRLAAEATASKRRSKQQCSMPRIDPMSYKGLGQALQSGAIRLYL